tara:strand:- start:821 stop:1015 length:195 start_codon:yes stop_codon:yes gene_type:complete
MPPLNILSRIMPSGLMKYVTGKPVILKVFSERIPRSSDAGNFNCSETFQIFLQQNRKAQKFCII